MWGIRKVWSQVFLFFQECLLHGRVTRHALFHAYIFRTKKAMGEVDYMEVEYKDKNVFDN